MPAAVPAVPERVPRRARYLIPPDTPRRAEILAAATVAALLAGALFAQLTLVLTVIFHAFGKLTRLRPLWLLAPAACGLVLALAVGPCRALAGFAAAPRGVAAVLAQVAAHPASLPRAGRIPGVIEGAAGGQFPLALVFAAGLAWAAWWARWLHTSEWELPAYRAGLITHCRRWWTVTFIGSGGVVAPGGVSLGADLATGGPATVSWREAAGGVLVTGAAPAAVAATGFQFVHAAIRLRKPVLVVDLAADPVLPAALAAACGAAGASLFTVGAGGMCYDPLRGAGPDRAAGLVAGIIDWDGVPDQSRAAARECLATAFAVLAAGPGGPGAVTLGELAGLLAGAGAMTGGVARIPAWHPGGPALAARAAAAHEWLERDRPAAGLLAGQLTALLASELGRWLAPGAGPGVRISLDEVIRQRAVVFFSPRAAPPGAGHPGHARAAGMIAGLLTLDMAARYTELHEAGIAPDGLAWVSEGGSANVGALAGLLGAGAPLVPVLTTTSAGGAGELAGRVGVQVVHRLAGQRLAGQLAALAGTRLRPAGPGEVQAALSGHLAHGNEAARPASGAPGGGLPPFGLIPSSVVPAETLCDLGDGEFVLVAGRGTATRVVRARAVTGRIRHSPKPRRAPAHAWSR